MNKTTLPIGLKGFMNTIFAGIPMVIGSEEKTQYAKKQIIVSHYFEYFAFFYRCLLCGYYCFSQPLKPGKQRTDLIYLLYLIIIPIFV